MLSSIRELRATVPAGAASFHAGRSDGESATAAMQEWARIAHAADAAMALAAARVSACELPASAGARDAADLVAKTTGVTTAAAKDAVARGSVLAARESTREVATRGELSPAQASAIADAVGVNRAAEGELLAVAGRSSVGELCQACAAKKAESQDVAQIEQRIHARRCLRRWRDAEGAEHLHATGTKRDMAVIDQALKPFVDHRFKAARVNGERERLEACAFDALAAMAATTTTGGGGPAPTRRDPIRYLSILRADLSTLARGHVTAGETCEIAGLGPVAVATARQVLTESVLKLVLTAGVEVRNVTHLGRGPNTAGHSSTAPAPVPWSA